MQNTRWEYKVTQVHFLLAPPFDSQKPKNVEALKMLSDMGQNGWELIQAMPNQTGITICFWKREIKKPVDEWNM